MPKGSSPSSELSDMSSLSEALSPSSTSSQTCNNTSPTPLLYGDNKKRKVETGEATKDLMQRRQWQGAKITFVFSFAAHPRGGRGGGKVCGQAWCVASHSLPFPPLRCEGRARAAPAGRPRTSTKPNAQGMRTSGGHDGLPAVAMSVVFVHQKLTQEAARCYGNTGSVIR